MEEKERYEWNSRFDEAIKDNQTGDIVNAVEVLNKQDKRIKELGKKLDIVRQKDIIIRQNCRQGYVKDLEEMNNLVEENQQLKQQLSEKERQYETLYKLFSEQHEIIDQNELGCFEEVNRLLKEQKDFYIVEKAEYDKMKQGAKDIVKELKQQLADKDLKIIELETKLNLKDKGTNV